MAEPIPTDEQANYELFRDCMSEPVLKALVTPSEKPKARRKRQHKRQDSKVGKKDVSKHATAETEGAKASEAQGSEAAEDLGDFIDFLSTEIFTSLPTALRTLSYTTLLSSPLLQSIYSLPLSTPTYTTLLHSLPPTALHTLESSGLLPPCSDTISQRNLLLPIYTAYITATTAPPPIWSSTRTSACELCARDWVPLTYHHLIPRSMHEKVKKRGWHEEHTLNSVAWLCRACHSFVHGLAGNEVLARELYTVDLIVEGGMQGDGEVREKVQAWVKWIGGVRWRSR